MTRLAVVNSSIAHLPDLLQVYTFASFAMASARVIFTCTVFIFFRLAAQIRFPCGSALSHCSASFGRGNCANVRSKYPDNLETNDGEGKYHENQIFGGRFVLPCRGEFSPRPDRRRPRPRAVSV